LIFPRRRRRLQASRPVNRQDSKPDNEAAARPRDNPVSPDYRVSPASAAEADAAAARSQ